jgi:hypothetical protein
VKDLFYIREMIGVLNLQLFSALVGPVGKILTRIQRLESPLLLLKSRSFSTFFSAWSEFVHNRLQPGTNSTHDIGEIVLKRIVVDIVDAERAALSGAFPHRRVWQRHC